MRATAVLVAAAAATAAAATAKTECDPGQYYHDRGSYDCGSDCCPCQAGFFCPGSEAVSGEEPCPPGMTSLPSSSSETACTGPIAEVSQVHVAYTGVAGQLSVDFVALSEGPAFAFTSVNQAAWTATPVASTLFVSTIGHLHQALLTWPGVKPGQTVFYKVGNAGANSSVFPVTPIVDHPETFVVYGDFGAANDACLDSLIKDSQAGLFDTVLHVGDWAYNFETANSSVGNVFMQLTQAYSAVKPTMPVEGNHEFCGTCPSVANAPITAGNFSEYQARFHSVALFAGANAGSGSARYYSFNQGLVHFLVFSAEAYAYKSGAQFIANQLAFMKADLLKVDRAATPWVVALVHKTFWMEPEAYADFSPVLQDGGVDVLFCGHVHYYNRLYPYDPVADKIDTASVSADGSTYTDPKYVVDIVTGAPGDREDTSKYVKEAYSYTGSSNYGYGSFQAVNATTLTWSYKSIRASGTGPADYADTLHIVQTKHGLRNGGAALRA